jgi:hypothetical protein
MRFLSSVVVTALFMPAVLGVSSARAEQHPVQDARPDRPGRFDLESALKSFQDALRLRDRYRPFGWPDVIRPDPELDRDLEKRPPDVGSAMPIIVPRE